MGDYRFGNIRSNFLTIRRTSNRRFQSHAIPLTFARNRDLEQCPKADRADPLSLVSTNSAARVEDVLISASSNSYFRAHHFPKKNVLQKHATIWLKIARIAGIGLSIAKKMFLGNHQHLMPSASRNEKRSWCP